MRTIKVIIFYRKMPKDIQDLALSEQEIHLIKDGIFTYNGIKCPRATLTIDWSGTDSDKDRYKRAIDLLDYMVRTNNIIAYSVRK